MNFKNQVEILKINFLLIFDNVSVFLTILICSFICCRVTITICSSGKVLVCKDRPCSERNWPSDRIQPIRLLIVKWRCLWLTALRRHRPSKSWARSVAIPTLIVEKWSRWTLRNYWNYLFQLISTDFNRNLQ